MKFRYVLNTLGSLCLLLAAILLIPFGIAVHELAPTNISAVMNHYETVGFLWAMGASLLFGALLKLVRVESRIGNAVREGFAIVTFGWIILTFFGAIPLFSYLHTQTNAGLMACFTDSFFEIMSGFTTTGSTILTDIEALPRGILFWRSLTHWLGGMGIVTLGLAIFPASGITAYQMFRGEAGTTAEKLGPKLRQTATILWGVYALLTLVETLLLSLGGMSIFDALCHAFGTLATGGFSTRNASIAAYESPFIDWVITAFMFLGGINFMLHFQLLFRRDFSIFRNSELRFYATLIISAVLLSTLLLTVQDKPTPEYVANSYRYESLSPEEIEDKIGTESAKTATIPSAFRYSAFQIISLTTCTGYTTADYDLWPNAIRFLVVLLMIIGGCAGSTSGGIKMIRIQIVFKTILRELKKMIHPRLVAPIRMGNKPVKENEVGNIIGFFMLFIATFVVLTFLMSFFIDDFATAFTSVSATICGVGPGLSGVGATENFSWIPLGGKWVLTASMLLGRLELYTVIIAFSSLLTRKK
ncbi:MAG: TrkH family potassium uptake protein [Fibrobacterota bacterium]